MMQNPLIVALVAGERSGDILGAGLICALKKINPNIRFIGIAGPLMQAEGCDSWYEMEELSVMGMIEILGRLPRILYIQKDLIRRFIKIKPDIFIGIDSPDFNISLESKLKKHNILTIHYVSPSIWAWRKQRIFKIMRSTDLVLTLLPFEKAFYDRYHIPCRFIGHATADVIPINPDKGLARRILGIPDTAICLAILPGSRETEIDMLAPNFIKTGMLLQEKYSNLKILIPLVKDIHRKKFELIKAKVAPKLPIYLLEGDRSTTAMIASDAALLASGTATLECMLAKCPMVVGYRMKAFTFFLAKLFVKTKYISLPNLLAGCKLVTELLQKECEPKKLAAALDPLFFKGKQRDFLVTKFTQLHLQIRWNANEQAALAILERFYE